MSPRKKDIKTDVVLKTARHIHTPASAHVHLHPTLGSSVQDIEEALPREGASVAYTSFDLNQDMASPCRPSYGWDFVKVDEGVKILTDFGNRPGHDERDLFEHLKKCKPEGQVEYSGKVDEGVKILTDFGNRPGHDERDLFEHLKKCKPEGQVEYSGSHVFWIERTSEQKLFKNYNRKTHGVFPYPSTIDNTQRSQALLQIIMEIYDKKICHRHDLNFLNTLQGIDEARMERFRKTIKISTTLSIVYLILYRELTGSIQKQIEEFTKFVGNFLKKWLLEAQKVEDKFTRTWYDLANKRDTGATAAT
ncbi:hypothetical protein PCASD_17655 [Puccinia coronata f. sp. avenae]|nr:hypothetical protein PCASD_17655 [Puccinia coronata f. sp. avenae]